MVWLKSPKSQLSKTFCYFRGWILTRLIAMVGGEFLQGWFAWQGVDFCQVDCYGRGWILTGMVCMAGGGFLPGWLLWKGVNSHEVDSQVRWWNLTQSWSCVNATPFFRISRFDGVLSALDCSGIRRTELSDGLVRGPWSVSDQTHYHCMRLHSETNVS